jgi:gluconolactonase
VLLEGIDFPNGLAFGLAGDVLYLAETRTGRVLHYSWDGANLRPLGVFATLVEGGADGMAVDADGNLLVAVPTTDRIVCFAPDGTTVGEARFTSPTFPTNLCFAGDQRDILVITAAKGGRLLTVSPPGAGRGPTRVGGRTAEAGDRAGS